MSRAGSAVGPPRTPAPAGGRGACVGGCGAPRLAAPRAERGRPPNVGVCPRRGLKTKGRGPIRAGSPTAGRAAPPPPAASRQLELALLLVLPTLVAELLEGVVLDLVMRLRPALVAVAGVSVVFEPPLAVTNWAHPGDRRRTGT